MPKQIKDILYMDILKQSWNITWNHKYLWWFGFFLSLAGGSSFNWNSGSGNWGGNNQKEQEVWQKMTEFIHQHIPIIIAIAIIAIALYVFFIILATFSQGGIIKSINHILKNESTSFRSGIREGKKYFWKIFSLHILIFLFFIFTLIILFTPVIFLFYSESYIGGVLLAICAVLIFIPLAILAYFIRTYANIYIVSGEISVWPAIENASDLFLKNILASFIMALLFIPIGIVFGFAIILAIIMLLIVFGGIGAIAYFTVGIIPTTIIAITGLFIFLILLFIARSVYETFSQTAWILFFREIAAPNEEERVEEVIEELENSPKGLPDTGNAIKTAESEK